MVLSEIKSLARIGRRERIKAEKLAHSTGAVVRCKIKSLARIGRMERIKGGNACPFNRDGGAVQDQKLSADWAEGAD